MSKHMMIAGVVAALAVTGASAASASAAAPRAAECGDTLPTNGYLAHDLVCDDDRGITLSGAVTLDLRGHRLAGPGETSSAQGVTVFGGPAKVVNGTVEGWRTGIARDIDLETPTPTAVVRNVTLRANGTGVDAVDMTITLDKVTVTGGGIGIHGFYTPTITVTKSVISNNETGVDVGPGHLTITGSQILTNRGAGVSCGEGFCTLDRNRFSGNDVAVFGSLTGVDLTRNVIADNGSGYSGGFQDFPSIVGNRFTGNDVGVDVTTLSDVTIRDNTFTGNDAGVRASGSADDYRGTLTGNTFRGNGDGVNLPAAQDMSLGRNRSVNNTGWGIYAPGATDLGGNTARGNGNQPQCVGVTC